MESSSITAASTPASPAVPRRHADRNPSHVPSRVDTSTAPPTSSRVHPIRWPRMSRTGRPYRTEYEQVALGQGGQVVLELFAHRLVEAELAQDLVALVLGQRAGRLGRQQVVDGVAWGETGEGEVEDDRRGEDQQVLEDPPDYVARHRPLVV